MDDLLKAKQILSGGNFTAVLCKNEKQYTSVLRGVKPLVIWMEDKNNYYGYSAADKVVGKATAFLYLLLGVKAVFAQVISKPAIQILETQGVFVGYETVVDNIINRQGNGICPFEECVLPLNNKESAYVAICEKMKEMNITL